MGFVGNVGDTPSELRWDFFKCSNIAVVFLSGLHGPLCTSLFPTLKAILKPKGETVQYHHFNKKVYLHLRFIDCFKREMFINS